MTVRDGAVGAAPLRHSATNAFSVMPAAWFAALFARHSALQAATVFCWPKAECDGAIVAKAIPTIPQIVAMDNVLMFGPYTVGYLARFSTRMTGRAANFAAFVISA